MPANPVVAMLAIALILMPGMIFSFAPRLVADAVVAVERADIWLISGATRAFHAEATAREAAFSVTGQ